MTRSSVITRNFASRVTSVDIHSRLSLRLDPGRLNAAEAGRHPTIAPPSATQIAGMTATSYARPERKAGIGGFDQSGEHGHHGGTADGPGGIERQHVLAGATVQEAREETDCPREGVRSRRQPGPGSERQSSDTSARARSSLRTRSTAMRFQSARAEVKTSPKAPRPQDPGERSVDTVACATAAAASAHQS